MLISTIDIGGDAVGVATGVLLFALIHNKPTALRVGFLLVASSTTFNTVLVHVPQNVRAFAPILALCLYITRPPLISRRSARGKMWLASTLFVGISIPLAITAVKPTRSVADIGLLVAVLCSASIIVSRSNPSELREAIFLYSAILTLASVTVSALHSVFPEALLGGRWTGVFTNPNSLGVVAALAVVTCRPRTFIWLVTLVIGGVAVYESGSRSALLGLAFGLVIILLRRYPNARRTILAAGLLAAVPLVIITLNSGQTTPASTISGNSSIFRSINSRSQAWGASVGYIRQKPATGYGAGDAPGQAASGALLTLEELGLLGFIPLSLLLADATNIIRRNEDALKAPYVVLLIEGLFETWYFDPGSPLFILFLLLSTGSAVHQDWQSPRRASRHALATTEDTNFPMVTVEKRTRVP